MDNRSRLLKPICLTACLCAPFVSHATDLQNAVFATPCAGCHGPNGISPGNIPSINHLSKNAIVFAMKAFKNDKRPGTVMNRIAKGYSDKEISLMAEYFENINKKD